ncbi:MAG: O-antigen ligase family protein [Patescibacteria group bacterium]
MFSKKLQPKVVLRFTLVWAIYAWVFVLPWQTRLLLHEEYLGDTFWEYASVSLYAHELLAFGIFILYIADRIVFKRKRSLREQLQAAIIKKPVTPLALGAVLLLLVIVSGVWSLSPFVTLTRAAHALAAIFVVGITWELRISWQRLASLLIGAGIIQGWLAVTQFLDQKVFASSVLGIAEQLPNVRGVSVIQYENTRWLRAYGSLPHPNVLGGIISMIFGLYILMVQRAEVISTSVKQRSVYWYRFALYGSQVFLCSALLLSFSRAAWIASTLIFLILFFASKVEWQIKKKTFLRVLFIGLITTLLWVGLFPKPFLARLQGTQPLERQSIEERTLSYADSLAVSKDYALFGTGFGTYTHALIKKYPERVLSINQPVHNSWLLVLNEIGVLAIAVLGAIFIRVYMAARSRRVAGAFLVALVVLMVFDHWWVSLVFGNAFLALMLYFAKTGEV